MKTWWGYVLYVCTYCVRKNTLFQCMYLIRDISLVSYLKRLYRTVEVLYLQMKTCWCYILYVCLYCICKNTSFQCMLFVDTCRQIPSSCTLVQNINVYEYRLIELKQKKFYSLLIWTYLHTAIDFVFVFDFIGGNLHWDCIIIRRRSPFFIIAVLLTEVSVECPGLDLNLLPTDTEQYSIRAGRRLINHLRHIPMGNATPQWATPYPIMSYATPQWATQHPNEQRHTLMSYATPQWATPHPNKPRHTQLIQAKPKWANPIMIYAIPQWATPFPNEQRHIPLSDATPYWATPHPKEQRHTP